MRLWWLRSRKGFSADTEPSHRQPSTIRCPRTLGEARDAGCTLSRLGMLKASVERSGLPASELYAPLGTCSCCYYISHVDQRKECPLRVLLQYPEVYRKYTCKILTRLMRDLAVWLLKALPPGIVVSEVWTRSNAALQASPWCCCVLALEIAMVVACAVRVLHGGGVLGLHEEGASLCAGWSRAMSACPYASLSMALLCPDAVLVYCSRMAESCSPSRGRPQMSCLHGQCGMGNLRQVTYAHPSARSCRFLNGAGVAV